MIKGAFLAPTSGGISPNTCDQGWDEGVVGMKVGGERLLIVPPSLGYGNRKMPDIPANSILRFGEPINRYLGAFLELITSCQRSNLSA